MWGLDGYVVPLPMERQENPPLMQKGGNDYAAYTE